ncbi:DUF2207 family protein [Desertihabitans aurantiacus]|uniref:DUF2207 family protein n=1 Tax=Desertihabitans aurantiacus TaxID=2282477 RepID=UPI000DF84054|nr:DUF2207 domain-containing protein [Desertihabitans aurantiacus]
MTRPLSRAVLMGLLALVLAAVAVPARAEGNASLLDIQVQVESSGVARVTETLTFDGEVPEEITQRIAVRENILGDREHVYAVTDVQVEAGQPLTPEVEQGGDAVTVTVPTAGVSGPVSISYTVSGATFESPEGTQFRWRVLQGLSVSVSEVTGQVALPGLPTDFQCRSGAPDAANPGVCRFSAAGTDDNPVPVFGDGARGEGEMVELLVTVPAGVVEVTSVENRRWTLGGAFSVDPLPLGLALGVLVLGGLAIFLLHRRAGRDAAPGQPTRVAEFRPVAAGRSEFSVLAAVRPGQVGTVVDERVDPIDITASLIDLAVRGHLRIIELPRADEFARTDWKLVRRSDGDPSQLAGWEQRLLEALTPPEGRDGILVSEIGPTIAAHIADVQSALYDDVVRNGWFERRPDSTRNRWGTIGTVALVVAVVATGLLVALTTFGLLGLALLAVALGLVFVGQEMPARTTAGSSLLAGLDALRAELQTHPTEEMPPGRELHELSEVLPYTIVLGGRDRWIDAIVTADDDDQADSTDLAWYHGPDRWHLQHLPESLKNFISTTSGNLFAR